MSDSDLNVELLETPAPSDDTKRDRSTIDFPYLDLDAAVEVAKAVYQVSGQSCQWDQLAAQMGQASKGGGFRMRVVTAKTFGLLTYTSGTVTLTKLGSQICDPESEAAAKAEAFLCVELYRAVYETYKGVTLPPAPALENEMVKMGVAQKQKDKARQAFQRSATSAGFFAFGQNKLVMPSIKGSKKVEHTEDPKPGIKEKETEKPDEKKKRRHPFIEGLLDKLPEADTPWAREGRKKWLQTASNIFDLMYTADSDDDGELSVMLTKTSAK